MNTTKGRFITILAGALLGLSTAATAQTYTIGANPQGSVFYAAAAAIAKVAVDKTGLQFRVAPYAGSSTYIPLVNKGELAFGMSNGAEYAFAYSGTELFAGHKNENLRSMLVTFALTNGFAVRTDSPMKTVADLKGKKVPVGYPSGRIFHKDLEGVPAPNSLEGVNPFMAGRTDDAYVPFNSRIGKQAMATISGGWRYLSIGNAADADAKADAFLPTARTVKMKPNPNATGVVDNPTVLLAVDVAMFAGAQVPDEVVYKVVKTIFENKPDLIKALAAFARFDPKKMARPNPVPYHPGAIKAYTELGMWPPK